MKAAAWTFMGGTPSSMLSLVRLTSERYEPHQCVELPVDLVEKDNRTLPPSVACRATCCRSRRGTLVADELVICGLGESLKRIL
eukprot:6478376-Amphidinium_carterae.2